MKLTEKAAYIKGLMEGMKFDDASDSNKLLAKLTEIVSDMAHAIDELEEKTDRTNDYVDELDYDLGELEELRNVLATATVTKMTIAAAKMMTRIFMKLSVLNVMIKYMQART